MQFLSNPTFYLYKLAESTIRTTEYSLATANCAPHGTIWGGNLWCGAVWCPRERVSLTRRIYSVQLDNLLMHTGEWQQIKTHTLQWVNNLTGWWVPVLHDKRQIHLSWQLLSWQKLVWVCMFVFLVVLLKSTQVNVKRNAEATWGIHSKHSRVGAVVWVQEKVMFLPARQRMKWNECLLCVRTWCVAFWGHIGHYDMVLPWLMFAYLWLVVSFSCIKENSLCV